ncbi:MAG TPA: hypothetical protein VNS99_15870 [Gaiellales bacterium]|nr:hypothetical protein [Gaiellales bacterium]
MSISRWIVVVPVLAGLAVTGTAVARMLPRETVRDTVYQTCQHNGVHFNKQGHANCGLHKGWSHDPTTATGDEPGSQPGDGPATESGGSAGHPPKHGDKTGHGKGHGHHGDTARGGSSGHGHGGGKSGTHGGGHGHKTTHGGGHGHAGGHSHNHNKD